jgi:hypothetical protein
MDGHDIRHELTSDHDHADDFTVRRVGWAHNHDPSSAGPRRADPVTTTPDNYDIVYAWNTDDNPAAILAGSATIVRTVSAWDTDGNLVRPCQFGGHANLKYNVVQLHHKDPVGLGGPGVNLDYERDCGWERGLRGLGACGLHHDDTHLLWRMAIKSGQSAAQVLKVERVWRGMFGRKVIHAVEHGWLDRMTRINLALLEGKADV